MQARPFNSSISPTLSTFLTKFKNRKLINQYYSIYKQFYGFDLEETSANNITQIIHRLKKGNKAFNDHLGSQKSFNLFQNFKIQPTLRSEEQDIFNQLLNSFTLKHATDSIDAILSSGKMLSVRELETQSKKSNRHTWKQNGDDRSIYFTFGIGGHKTPSFLNDATHIININLKMMRDTDINTTERLWVSGHVTEYQKQTRFFARIGNVDFSITHHLNKTKTYTFKYHTGETLEWCVNYQDEVFVGKDVLPGIAYQFIYMLRLLGGENNPFVKKLYHSTSDINRLNHLLEKIFSLLMPGWVYPEAKIIGELDIQQPYVTIRESKLSVNHNFLSIQFEALKNAVKRNNYSSLLALLRMGYRTSNYYTQLLFKNVFENIKDPDLRIKFLQIFIKFGFKHIIRGSKGNDDSAIHHAIKHKDIKALQLLLTTPCVDIDEPLLSTLPNPNMSFESSNSGYENLADYACGKNDDGTILALLKDLGVNFKENGYQYLKSAIQPYEPFSSNDKPSNYKAIAFLKDEGVTAEKEDAWNLTPLMLACKKENADIDLIQFLIHEMNANVNTRLKSCKWHFLIGVSYDDPLNGMTALHFAAEVNNIELVKYLLSEGADPTISSFDGRLAADLTQNSILKSLLTVLPTSESQAQCFQNQVTSPEASLNMPNHKVAILLTGTNNDGSRYIVLGKRYHHDHPDENYYCFPGGAADVSDQTYEAAAKRELYEETGVNVNHIPTTKIFPLASINGFIDHTHQFTHFYVMDIGAHPIEVHASDDLIEAIKVPLEKININPNQPRAIALKYNNIKILGSNALLILYSLLSNKNQLTDEELLNVSNQLHIEEQGYDILESLIQHNQSDIYPESQTWQKIEMMLTHFAHKTKKSWIYSSISLAMMHANPYQGTTLLAKYGVNLSAYQEQGRFKIDDDEYYGTALYYTVITNQLDLLKHMVSLGASLTSPRHNDQQMLQKAAKNGYRDILFYLLDQGLDPNLSYDKNGNFIYYPIIAMTIKYNHHDLMKELLNDKRILVNRERSPISRSTALMTAIEHKNKIATFHLLTICRLNLTAVNQDKKSAVMLADEIEWHDIASIITFLAKYPDMNAYLHENGLPVMDQFIHIITESNQPTIHFISDDINKIKEIAKQISSSCDIHSNENGYYIRLGNYRLAKLVGQTMANYFLTYTKNTPFWNVHPNVYQSLQTDLTNNTLTILDSKVYDIVDFDKLADKEHFSQLIKENPKLIKVILELTDSHYFKWLINAIKEQDRIETVKLQYKSQMDNDSIHATIHCLLSLVKLKKIECVDLPFDYLLSLFSEYLSRQINHIYFVISGSYSNDEYHQLLTLIESSPWRNEINFNDNTPENIVKDFSEIVIQNQIKFHSKECPSFKIKLDNLNQSSIDTLTLNCDDQKNHLITKISMQQLKPSFLQITSLFCEDHLDLICSYIKKTNLIDIEIKCNQPWQTQQILEAITTAPQTLKILIINPFMKLETDGITALTLITKHQPLEQLKLDYVTFHTTNTTTINQLATAIAECKTLKILLADNCKFNESFTNAHFMLTICNNKSLLSMTLYDFIYLGYRKLVIDKVNQMLTDNSACALRSISGLSIFTNNLTIEANQLEVTSHVQNRNGM